MIYKLRADKLTAQNLKNESKSTTYIASEDLSKDSNLGQLFIVAEINSKEKKVPTLLEQTVKEMSEYYYHSPTKNAESALETTCQYFNENICDITSKPQKWIKDKFHIIVVAIQDNRLVMSNLGEIKIWLFRNGKMHDLAGTQNDKNKIASKKLLSHLVSGRLENNDAIMLTTKTIFDYFTDDKIRQTITTLAPTQACAFFKNTVLDYKIPIDFNTIIVKFAEAKKIATNDDMRAMSIIAQNQQKNSLKFTKKKSTLNTMLSFGKQSYIKIISLFIGSIKNLKNKKTFSAISRKTADIQSANITNAKDAPEGLIKNKKFSLSQHRLKIAIILIVILFAASLFVVNQKKEKQTEIVNIQSKIEEINDKINTSEAALIYKDEAKAQKLILEAQTMLASLPQSTNEQIYQHQELAKTINEHINKIYNVTEIENPTAIVAFDAVSNSSSNILLAKNNLYYASGKTIYKINHKEKTSVRVADVAYFIDQIIPFETNSLLLFNHAQNKMILFNIDNNTSRLLNFNLPSEISSNAGLGVYAKKLYLLDTGQNQIYKYNYTDGGFSSPTEWLAEKIDLSGYSSLAIDGNIWLSAKNGNIAKFFKGKQEILKITGCNQAISDNTSVYTDDTLDYIYIIDMDNNQIILTDKQGKVANNLVIKNLEKIKSAFPAPDEKIIYLLTDKNIYEINL
ncbi:hypothetical protein COT27_00775 [Candidatus Kuenenbacteria bacterium CG08_land_8_20_14_0_20_37_23]|uniref:PPM-type phosphatase domain-containing protein n=2 Tax=Candidatus Kueneniibacteriota TaxID=1752740 RepID=A0A2M6XTB6_9BACT|nr:MAG: hypothetical protein AUJ29_01360 [Candidatus Kuenenbacteria bacterium CG1_02_38_13]PIU10876.1 MAG: hypothetical protein COT27_00775 [Candidatus Kuenenbacteria bacterium CG08_land_8_20_14_0_20_37_23]